MPSARWLGGRVALLLATLTVMGVVVGIYRSGATASGNPTLTGDFCTFNGSMLCMSITWNGTVYGTANLQALDLQPGTYTLIADDTAAFHDFVLRACPGSALPCDSSNPAAGTPTTITTRTQVATVTETIDLTTPGTYRLFCDVTGHEAGGMYVDFTIEAPPIVTNSVGGGNATAAYGGQISPALTVSAGDADSLGSDLTASATGLPPGLNLSTISTSDSSTLPGTRAWTVNGSDSSAPGTYPVTVTVVDDDANAGTTSFTITVGTAPLVVTADDQSRLFGASNPPLTATLTGFVLGQTLATSDVTGGASCTTTATSYSAASTYPITCTLGTLFSTNYGFTSFLPGTLTVATTEPCLTGRNRGPLTILAGQAICTEPGARLDGPVTVETGGAIDLEGATVKGPLSASGATAVRMCGTTVNGRLSISGGTGLVLIGGDAATGPCDGNTITGPVDLIGNTGGVEFNGIHVKGALKISGTTGTLPDPDAGSLQVSDIKVSGPTRITP